MTFDFTKPSGYTFTYTPKSENSDTSRNLPDFIGTPPKDELIWYHPLLVSCYLNDANSHELRINGNKRYVKMEGLLTQPHILKLYEDVKHYYKAKISQRLFMQGGVSKYRQDVLNFLNGETLILDERDLGMIARLPEYYKYDTHFENVIVPGLEGWDDSVEVTKNHWAPITTLKVKYRLERNAKSGQTTSKKIEFYCQASNDNAKYPVMIDTTKKEFAASVLDYCFSQNKTIRFNPEMTSGKYAFINNKPIFKLTDFQTLQIQSIQ